MRESGLSSWVVQQVPLGDLGSLGALCLFAVVAAVMTTFISNSATANLLIPIVVGVSALSPRAGAAVIALVSSAAMILPVSTPPNAIAYGSKQIEIKEMMKAGAIITAIAVLLVPIFVHFVL